MSRRTIVLAGAFLVTAALGTVKVSAEGGSMQVPKPEYFLKRNQTHNKFSRAVPPVIRVPSGAVIQAETEEASDGQLAIDSGVEDLSELSFDPIHPLTGPVYVEGAEPGDVLAVTLHKLEVGDWGWTAIIPGFGFLADEFEEPYLKTYRVDHSKGTIVFDDGIEVPIAPFPGVMGVAPDTDEMLSTVPPRANGGNMDDPNMTAGTTVYFPVLVEGALFSIGDTHAAQGFGEVCGSAIEAPMTVIFQVDVLEGKPYLKEPQYESADSYAVTAFATTIDEAATKATRFMIEYLTHEHGLSRNDAYALCSVAANLQIAEVVDVPHMLVSMHMPKSVLGAK